MIELKRITQFPEVILKLLESRALQNEKKLFDDLKRQWPKGDEQYNKKGEGFFLVKLRANIIGIGSIQQSPLAPPTSGIALLQYCYIIPRERRKGYGTQLYKLLVQFAKNEFDLLQLVETCPLKKRKDELINLSLE